MDRYSLEILEPGSEHEILAYYVDSRPFGAIAVGDEICGSFSGKRASNTERLRVTRIEHILWNAPDGLKHKICVHTERIGPSP